MSASLPLTRFLTGFDIALEWWLTRLSEVVPSGFRSIFTRAAPRAALIVQEDGVAYAALTRGRYLVQTRDEWLWDESNRLRLPRSVTRRFKSGERIALRINPNLVLVRALSLPLAAEPHLKSILALQFDHHFPLGGNCLVTDHIVVSKDSEKGSINVQLAAMRRVHLDAFLDAVAAEKLVPAAVSVDMPERAPTDGIDFLRSRSHVSRRSVRRVNAALMMLLVGLVWGAHSLIEVKRAQELATISDAITQLNPQEEQVRALSAEIATLRSETQLTRSVPASGTVLRLLHELARDVPDNAWLGSFEYSASKGDVSFSGFSADANALLSQITKLKLLREPSLRGAITKDAKGRDRFDIAARLRMEPGS